MRPFGPRHLLSFSLFIFATLSFLFLTGCGAGFGSSNAPGTAALAIQGTVHGGQQAVNGAVIQLYRAGKAGNGSSATAMLTKVVTTDASGSFSITGDYSCVSADDQLYIVATGGNPGLSQGTNNTALVMMAALGRCADAPNIPFIFINEVTTVAAAYALAPFSASSTSIGASSTNAAGLTNAFLDAHLLADTTSGSAALLPVNIAVETGKLYALADAIAGCINSPGGASCSPLFTAATPPNGTAPADTFTAALNIVKNPTNNVGNVYGLISATPPFPTSLTQAPNDWSMSMSVTGGGLAQPSAIGVASDGTVWVAGHGGALSGFTPQGTALSSSGFGVGTLNESYGLTIDNSDNVWVSSEEVGPNFNGTVAEFEGYASGSPGTLLGNFYDGSINYPESLATAPNGNILIGNYANSSATVYNTAGSVVSSYLGSGNANFPVAVAADANNGVWLGNISDNTLTHVAADGTFLSRPACCGAIQGIATDAAGNVWTANFSSSSLSEVANNGTVLITRQTSGGLAGPVGVAIDAAQNIWMASYHGASISQFAGSTATTPGAPLNTSLGLDAKLQLPFGIAPDRSGNVWVASFNNNKLVMFFGLATPTATPVRTAPSAP